MKFTYISPSELPSRAANSVHVVMQCSALIQAGVDLTLYAKRSVPDNNRLLSVINKSYGIDFTSGRIVSFWSSSSRGTNLRIAAVAIWDMIWEKWPDVVLSRNLYASFIISVFFRRPLLFETHQLETGLRKFIQCRTMLCDRVVTVVISEKLEEYLIKHHNRTPSKTLVLHDAAPEGIQPIEKSQRYDSLLQVYPRAGENWDGTCGYFGHLYAGRGIEVIEEMAAARPNVLFLLFGGNEVDVHSRRQASKCENVRYLGHVPHPIAQQAMRSVDALLMPYQESVSIGISGHDTARWMSPMKMFEYMATGVPIISSNLPVLLEVLKDGSNALLVSPSDSASWVNALDKLLEDDHLAHTIGVNAHEDYKMKHTWRSRALRLISAAKEL